MKVTGSKVKVIIRKSDRLLENTARLMGIHDIQIASVNCIF